MPPPRWGRGRGMGRGVEAYLPGKSRRPWSFAGRRTEIGKVAPSSFAAKKSGDFQIDGAGDALIGGGGGGGRRPSAIGQGGRGGLD